MSFFSPGRAAPALGGVKETAKSSMRRRAFLAFEAAECILDQFPGSFAGRTLGHRADLLVVPFGRDRAAHGNPSPRILFHLVFPFPEDLSGEHRDQTELDP